MKEHETAKGIDCQSPGMNRIYDDSSQVHEQREIRIRLLYCLNHLDLN